MGEAARRVHSWEIREERDCFRAVCNCGWRSRLCALRSQAETNRDDHISFIIDGRTWEETE